MRAPAPAYAATDLDALTAAFGGRVERARADVGEASLHVGRDALVGVLRELRDQHEFQQLMEIAGVDYPDRAERFEVVYCLLSVTKNQRIRVHVATDEETPVPTVTGLWPVAGWLEREVYDLYGVFFEGNQDLRRILTDYGFTGHPLRKDFPQTGYVELRYSEEAKRVVYEPVRLAQDFRTFDFTSPWEGAEYVLPGDEKAEREGQPVTAPAATLPQAKGAPSPVTADQVQRADATATPKAPAKAGDSAYGKTAESTADTGAGKPHPHGSPTPPDPDVVPKRRTARAAQSADATDEAPGAKRPRAPRRPKGDGA